MRRSLYNQSRHFLIDRTTTATVVKRTETCACSVPHSTRPGAQGHGIAAACVQPRGGPTGYSWYAAAYPAVQPLLRICIHIKKEHTWYMFNRCLTAATTYMYSFLLAVVLVESRTQRPPVQLTGWAADGQLTGWRGGSLTHWAAEAEARDAWVWPWCEGWPAEAPHARLSDRFVAGFKI